MDPSDHIPASLTARILKRATGTGRQRHSSHLNFSVSFCPAGKGLSMRDGESGRTADGGIIAASLKLSCKSVIFCAIRTS